MRPATVSMGPTYQTLRRLKLRIIALVLFRYTHAFELGLCSPLKPILPDQLICSGLNKMDGRDFAENITPKARIAGI